MNLNPKKLWLHGKESFLDHTFCHYIDIFTRYRISPNHILSLIDVASLSGVSSSINLSIDFYDIEEELSDCVSSSSLRQWTADQDQLDNRQLTHDQLSKWSLANIALISTSLPNLGSVTSIDVTLVAHIRHQGDLPFFVHGRSTICTAVPLTSAVMLSRTRSSLLRR